MFSCALPDSSFCADIYIISCVAADCIMTFPLG
jgi:hypothetical protein